MPETSCVLSIGSSSCISKPEACIKLTVKLKNVNDNPPAFDRLGLETNINLPENQNNHEIMKFIASDLDRLGKLQFTIEGSNAADYPFSLSEISGEENSAWLSVNGSLLDYEKQLFWSLKIIVEVNIHHVTMY